MKHSFVFSALFSLALPGLLGQTVPDPAGLWDFADAAQIGKATVGPALATVGSAPGQLASLADDGGVVQNGVLSTVAGPANRLRLTHGIAANGGGSYVNEYTLLFDIFSPSASRGSWRCLFQTDSGNTSDGDYFIRNNNDQMGTAALGYTTNALNETRWKRVVIVADLPSVKVYVDGALFFTHANQTVDGRYALGSTLQLFADEDNENASLRVAATAIWNKPLTAVEVGALGLPGAPILGAAVPNAAPVITEGTSLQMPTASLNGPAVTAALNATDAEGDPISWSVGTQASHGTAAIVSSSGSGCVVGYTPAPGFSGLDSFQVSSSDGQDSDSIEMNVLVLDPNAPPWRAPVGLWEFDFPVDPTLATIGTSLTPSGTGFTPVNGAFADDAAQQVALGSYYRVSNPVGANGGGTISNRYTLMWDIFIPTNAASQWKTLFQINPANSDDGDLFINTSRQLGTAAGLGGYSTNTLSAGTWNRVVLKVVNGTTNGTSIWVNGSKWMTTTTADGIDGRYGLGSQFLLFADNDGDDGTIQVSNVAIWDDAIGDAEIVALGGATGRVSTLAKPTPNHPPVIAGTDPIPLVAQMNATATLALEANDEDGDPVTWTVGTAAANGTVSINNSSDTTAAVVYTPALNFTGSDTFTIKASDGEKSDSVVVNVSVQNGAPVIAEGDSYNLSAIKDGGARTVVFQASDPNGNPLVWNISSAPSHGVAEISGNNNTSGEVRYTPEPGYSGSDSFMVGVTDGVLIDGIEVRVVVTDPGADPKLTVVSAHGSTHPAPGAYPHPRGTSLTNSASNETGETTRHIVTGWTLTGDGPSSGTTNPMTFTLTRDSVLTWQFRSEHRVETAVSGNGTVSLSSGWFEAGKPLVITAVPAAGHHFTGWTGDTAGCQTGAKSIALPMDRAYATITANFATDENFTFVALPDTQNYTSITSPTDLYTRQTQWVLDNRETMNIKFVTHLGDIVNSPSSQAQWQRATDAMNLMDNRMPYGTCPGNHDIGSGNTDYLRRFGPNPTHASSVGRWLDPVTNQTYDWYKGASPRGYSSYQVVHVNGRDFMFLHMDHDAPDQDLAWAASVLSAHPKVLTMVTTHNYLAETGGTGIFGSGTGERGYTAQANVGTWGDRPDTNRPQEVFDAIVKPFNQVYMVICGHMFATYNLEKTNNAGNTVHEVLVDYQSLPNGGNGFLRIMDFRPGENKIYNTSYSPYLGRYIDPNLNADHQGMLDLHDRNGGEFVLNTDFDTRFNNTLNVVSPYGGVSPAAGAHDIEDGTPVAINAEVFLAGQTRRRPVGWTLTGSQTASGAGSSAVITQNGDATLTWTYSTEYQLSTATVGGGIVSTGGGWHTADSIVNIQAQPDAGQSFLQWSGDIAGCIINGTTISVTMDRPRGPITAEFSSARPSYSVEVVSAFPGASPAAATYTYDEGSTVTFTAADLPGADTRRICTGYHYSNGSGVVSGNGTSVTLVVNENTVLTWDWKSQYLVTTAVSGPGTVSAGGWFDENSAVTLSATPEPGAMLSGWTGDTALGSPAGNDFKILSLTRPAGPVTASFEAASHVLTVNSTQATVTPPPGAHGYSFGQTIEFSAVSDETNGSRQRPTGWTLSGGTNLSGEGTKGSFVMAGDTTLTWTFTPEVLLAVTGGNEGAILPMDSAGWKALGSRVDLHALAPPFFTFRRWTGDVPAESFSGTISLIMDQPRSITADLMPLTVSDGTPRWWLKDFTQVTAGDYESARLNDSDGDGEIAADEYVAGMSDLDARQRFGILSFTQNAATGKFHVTAPARDRRLYQVAESADLAGAFEAIGSPVAFTGAFADFDVTRPAGASRNFYSVKVSLGTTGPRDADPAAASSAPLPGSLEREMRRIPGGTFQQGDAEGPTPSRPVHPVQVAGFMMDRFEVTRADWEKVATWAQAHGYDIPILLRFNQPPYNVPANHPAVAVSWYDSVKWCNARSEMEGRRPVYFTDTTATTVYRTGEVDLVAANVNWSGDGYRLPTESEWERASRGGLEGRKFPWGDEDADLRSNSWNFQLFTGRAPDEEFPYTERVGYFDGTQPGGMPNMENGYGLHDMSANAWEWTWDRMGDYTRDKQYDPKGPDSGTVQRVQRGGSWWNYVDQATNFQRLPFPPNGSDDYGMIGFRCIRGLHPNE
ncbi:SUMF1/EgtB/PvdO family nonheme iron enzyme [Luteolibacter yonseiensis]|uniref:SUMF1/EgtB/PvdO family nonheme iron enzyme n=1 Tax=Luteolibacter yonseiensis TaxID=1144680 RepID=A0A934V5Q6_9BACT|nr:SUMF1/EgtB/PvdO family nonheme iron enzyme [Luteolibacter yonseiensis]MBK1814207.1 SUMF1/EgtB/PvdO family nonheme iron enzyme [Luteolibacter yonseiensis]